MQTEYGADQIVSFENHVSQDDPFSTAETTARWHLYDPGGTPAVVFDGSKVVEGAVSCAAAGRAYGDAVNQRMGQTGGMSPVSITAGMTIDSWNAVVTATYELVDPVQLSDLHATLLLYEDNVEWCCGYDGVHTWQGVTRRIYDQDVTLAVPGDEVTVTISFPIAADWRPAELHAVAFLQDMVTKEIIQGALVHDLSIAFDAHVDSVPERGGMRTFHGVLRNLRSAAADFRLRISTAFGDWPTDFIVDGDPLPHTLPLELEIPSGGSRDVYVRCSTDTTRGIRSGAFEVTCLNTGTTETNAFRLFNGGPALCLVDNDGGSNYELPLVHAITANGYLYEEWDVLVHMGTPSSRRMRGYDVLLWESAGRVPDVLTEGDMATLMAFMDGGGSLFVTTNYYLNSLDYVNNTFTRDYLGVDDWTLDRGYLQMGGVAGDAIGDGIDLALDFRFPAWAVGGDDAEPVPGATTAFLAEDGSHAMIRNVTASGSRSVFMPQRFDAVSETDPDPNNAKTLIHRVVEWLRPEGSAGADDRTTPPSAGGIEIVSPNPFQARTEIRFTLSASEARAPVRLEVFDLGGRRVVTIHDGALLPGARILSWDGRTSGGTKAPSGVYLARLSTRTGTRGARLILIR